LGTYIDVLLVVAVEGGHDDLDLLLFESEVAPLIQVLHHGPTPLTKQLLAEHKLNLRV
jgi:hypothetical protein